MASLCTVPIFLYALALTGSRSVLSLDGNHDSHLLKSKKRILLILFFGLMIGTIFVNLSPDQKDRYLSIFSRDTKNVATAEGRTEG